MKIGTFNKTGDGQFAGRLETLTLSHDVTFIPNLEKENDKAPDFKIVVLGTEFEIGAGWNQKSKSTGNPYIKAKLDDPSFPYVLWGALTANDEGDYTLYWSRPKSSQSKDSADQETL